MSSRLSIWIPILLMVAITPFTPYLDLNVSRYFYDLGGGHFLNTPFFNFVYNYGYLPANLTMFASLVALLLSFIPRWKNWRNPALILVLTATLGTGLMVHAVLKDHWGRPRPKQVVEFGGNQPFRPFYKPNFFDQPEPSKSFTCGHCTGGFYFFAVAVVARRLGSKKWYLIAMSLAWILGITLSITRIAQGGHFLSDTLMSALILWLTALTCDYLVKEDIRKTLATER